MYFKLIVYDPFGSKLWNLTINLLFPLFVTYTLTVSGILSNKLETFNSSAETALLKLFELTGEFSTTKYKSLFY